MPVDLRPWVVENSDKLGFLVRTSNGVVTGLTAEQAGAVVAAHNSDLAAERAACADLAESCDRIVAPDEPTRAYSEKNRLCVHGLWGHQACGSCAAQAIRGRVKTRDEKLADDVIFGEWVYCRSHLNAHRSGWCTIGLEDKIGLGPVKDSAEAIEKCRKLGLRLYQP